MMHNAEFSGTLNVTMACCSLREMLCSLAPMPPKVPYALAVRKQRPDSNPADTQDNREHQKEINII